MIKFPSNDLKVQTNKRQEQMKRLKGSPLFLFIVDYASLFMETFIMEIFSSDHNLTLISHLPRSYMSWIESWNLK
jgi:hypothetical protein